MEKSPPAITLRVATNTDAEIMAEYRLRFNVELSPPQSEDAMKALRKNLVNFFAAHSEDKTFISVIASIGNETAGIGSMEPRFIPGNFKNPSGKWGFILNMYTVPSFRKRGVAGLILNKLITIGREMGLTAFELLATKEGQPVYEKAGFVIFPSPSMRLFPEEK